MLLLTSVHPHHDVMFKALDVWHVYSAATQRVPPVVPKHRHVAVVGQRLRHMFYICVAKAYAPAERTVNKHGQLSHFRRLLRQHFKRLVRSIRQGAHRQAGAPAWCSQWLRRTAMSLATHGIHTISRSVHIGLLQISCFCNQLFCTKRKNPTAYYSNSGTV